VSQYSSLLAPIAVDAVLHIVDPDQAEANIDLNNIRIVKKVGGTIDDSELSNGLILTQNVITSAGGPTRVEKARIGLIQFQLSPPKSDVRARQRSAGWLDDAGHGSTHRARVPVAVGGRGWRTQMESNIIVNDYQQMDRILKEERQYILELTKKIKKAGCNVLLIQKSILRDAVNDLALHYLSKLKIMVIKDIERDEVEFICKVRPPALRCVRLACMLPGPTTRTLALCGLCRRGARSDPGLQADRRHRGFHREPARVGGPGRGGQHQRRQNRQGDGYQERRPDGVDPVHGREPPRARGVGAVAARRALRHPLPRQETVGSGGGGRLVFLAVDPAPGLTTANGCIPWICGARARAMQGADCRRRRARD